METLLPTQHIVKEKFSGKLQIEGDEDKNYLIFRFMFDKLSEVHPLIITVKTMPFALLNSLSEHNCQEEKFHHYKCNDPELRNPIMNTKVLIPEFLLKDHKIEVIEIESQVSCNVC